MKTNTTFQGYTPYEWQRAVHSEFDTAYHSGKIVVVKSKRQCGKSLMCENELLRFAINHPNTISAMISPTLNQSRKVYKEITKAIYSSGVIKKKNASLLEIELINGSTIMFKSGAQKDGLRGITISGILILDESAYLEDSILELVLAWTNVYRAPILMVSTPRLKSGFFYEYFMLGLSQKRKDVLSIDWNDYDTSIFLSPEKLELYRNMLPKGQFQTEFLGEFIDGGSGVFDYDDTVWTATDDLIKSKSLYFGIDWANGGDGDYTVLTAFNEKGEQAFLQYTRNKTPLQQATWISEILNTIPKEKIKKVTCEINSIGTVYKDILKKMCPNLTIREFNTSNTSKRDIIEKLQAAFGEKTIKLINDVESRREFSAYAMEITPGGNITYNAPYGLHDDIVMASAIAWDSRTSNNGNYVISIRKR